MVFNGKECNEIEFKFDINTDFKEILKNLNNIELPHEETEANHVKNGVLELINNSLRAHREKQISDPIIVSFKYEKEGNLIVQIIDYGKGFDPKTLPCSLDEDPNNIDFNSKKFKEYQKKNNNLRFGMGLNLVRKIFNTFTLIFFDKNKKPIEWEPEKVWGTIITAKIRVS